MARRSGSLHTRLRDDDQHTELVGARDVRAASMVSRMRRTSLGELDESPESTLPLRHHTEFQLRSLTSQSNDAITTSGHGPLRRTADETAKERVERGSRRLVSSRSAKYQKMFQNQHEFLKVCASLV